jgi:putative transposase
MLNFCAAARAARRARYPKFKRKSAAASVRFQDAGTAWARGVVSLPKLGSLKLAESLPKVERPGLVTLSRDAAGHYHVSFCAEVETSWMRITHRVVGVDVGLTHLATLSTGEKIPNPKRYHARLKYLRQQQRCLARRQKGSRRREKQRLRVAAWMREMHAQKKTFWRRCSQRKREAGNGIEPVRRGSVSSAVKSNTSLPCRIALIGTSGSGINRDD